MLVEFEHLFEGTSNRVKQNPALSDEFILHAPYESHGLRLVFVGEFDVKRFVGRHRNRKVHVRHTGEGRRNREDGTGERHRELNLLQAGDDVDFGTHLKEGGGGWNRHGKNGVTFIAGYEYRLIRRRFKEGHQRRNRGFADGILGQVVYKTPTLRQTGRVVGVCQQVAEF